MASHGVPSGSADRHLVDELETSFKACLSSLVAPETVHVHDPVEQKTSMEQSIQRFLELAKETENFFLQRQLLMATSKPDNVVKEEIDDLKAELSRKNALLQKQQTKVSNWLGILQSMENGSNPQPQQQQHPQQQQQQLTMAQMHHQQQQQQQQQLARGNMSMNMGIPQGIPQPQGGMPPHQGGMPQHQGGMQMGGMEMQHGQGHGGVAGGRNTPGLMNAPLTGPLAHLEQAMSSIGGTSGFDRR